MEGYRRRQSDCMPRFDQSFSGLCEQNLQDTLQLKQRYLDAKAKRVPKTKAEKKHQDSSIQSSVHVQQKFLKRSSDDLDPGGGGGGGGPTDNFEPPVKLQCTNEGLTKFSVEIVQQLEFTTSAANSQPQQISTNVTVKTHANASVKSDVSSPKSNPDHQKSTTSSNIGLDVGTLVECVKQEPDNDFADLDQCAAALEKDAAANGGAGFGGFPDLIGDDTNDEIISSATFNDLISDISNYPDYELMKDFDFEDKLDIKNEDIKNIPTSQESKTTTSSPLLQQNNPRIPSYPNMDFPKTELSPAAQTLKQMAEQHQHKNQMGLSFTAARSPYGEFQFQGSDYGSPNSIHKNSPNFPQPDMIKQEMIFQGSDFDMKRKNPGIYKQQYSPYSSPSASSHGSPGYLPRSNTGPTNNSGAFGGGTPPRPPSGPGGGNNANAGTTNVQINQAQQLNISQQNHGHTIQVSAGQHVHLSGDLKGNVSIAAQQGMHFTQQAGQNNSNQSQSNSGANQQSPMSTPQHQSSPMSNGIPSQNPMGHPVGNQMSGGNIQMSGNQMGPNMQGSQGIPTSGNIPGNDNMGNSMPGPNNMGMPNSNVGAGGGMGGMNSNMGGPGGLPGSLGGMQHPSMHNVGGMGGHNDTYSMSQTQTINFTQQTLRRAGNQGMPNPMGPTGPMGPSPMSGPAGPNLGNQPGPGQGMGPRLMTTQSLEQQKLLHQQQMLRAQQQQQQQAAMQQHMVRPPPPDYKTSAGMMQGMQPRYATAAPPPSIRRMPMQPMPPSGPMMRSNMYMMQQQQQQIPPQQMPQRAGLYARQQGPIASMESMQHNAEWRHLLMSQQQNTGFTTMRPQFQQGFGMNSNNIQQISALQHQQQLRNQQAMVSGGNIVGNQQGLTQAQVMGQSNNPMAQMNTMNQTMLHMQQQQQQSMMQQQNSHLAMSSIHMQQSQSITVGNQSLQQSQQQQQQNLSLGNQLSNVMSSSNNPQNPQNALSSAFNPQADFNFEFLDNLAAGDGTAFSDQELLSSFDSDAGFNLDFS